MKSKHTVQNFNVLGMSCAACATRIDKTLNRQAGVIKAAVNYATATVQVEYDPQRCTPEQLRQTVQTAGYDLIIEQGPQTCTQAEDIRAKQYRRLRNNTIGAIAFAFPVLLLSFLGNSLPYSGLVMCLLATPVVFGFGNTFFQNAWKQLKHGSANMDTLVANSTGIAYFFSLFNLLFPEFWLSRGIEPHVYFEASSVIIAFILLGKLLEERAKGNTSAAIKKLMGLSPKNVTLISADGQMEIVSVEQIRPGDLIMVKPGERIAVDGTLTEGSSYVDESMLSGEPVAAGKQAGDKVYAGTLNQKGTFRFRADKVGDDTMLAHIIHMVQEAQGSKAPVQKTVDKIAAIFVPVIIGIALISFILWCLLASDEGFTRGLLTAITVLIIACPCALGLATPTALMVGIGKAAENGILIKNAECIETAKNIDTIILDKTGTITEGKPIVSHTAWTNDGEKEYSSLFCNLERRSEHPLAAAITTHYANLHDLPVDNFENIPGMGVKGSIQGSEYYAGSRKLLEYKSIAVPAQLAAEASRLETQAHSIVWFADKVEAIGFAAITDRIKENSAEAIKQLQKKHIALYMLTGDNAKTAASIAKATGLKYFKANMLPREKADFVQQLQRDGHKVGMVGDGINDSAALSQADLSIAMGTGSDIAMDTADMTIISADLTKIPEALAISALTVRTIRQNLFWAFFYNLISIPIAAGVLYPVCGFLLNPMIAGAAMAFSSVSVVTNSLRLRQKKLKIKNGTNVHPCNDNKNNIVMKKTFRVEGMMCKHCCAHVEKALNSIPGVQATVSIEPPVAIVEFTDGEYTLDELQNAVAANAGEYTLSPL